MTVYGLAADEFDDEYASELIIPILKTIDGPGNAYITSGLKGGSAYIGKWLAENYPDSKHLVILTTKKDAIEFWWEGVETAVHPIDPNGMLSARGRNLAIASRAEVFYSFPAYLEDDNKSKGSDVWEITRMVRRKNIPLYVLTQTGENWTENIS